jgi:hypothetical protein
LRQNQRTYFYERLDALFPGAKEKYIRTFGDSYACISPNSGKLFKAFKEECERYGLLNIMSDIVEFIWEGYQQKQLSFF